MAIVFAEGFSENSRSFTCRTRNQYYRNGYSWL